MVWSLALAASVGRTAKSPGFLSTIPFDSSSPKMSDHSFKDAAKYFLSNARTNGSALTIARAESFPYNFASSVNVALACCSVMSVNRLLDV